MPKSSTWKDLHQIFTATADRIVETSSDASSVASHFSMSAGKEQARPSTTTTWGLVHARSVTTNGLPSTSSMSGLHVTSEGDRGASSVGGGDEGPSGTSTLDLFLGPPSSATSTGCSQPSALGEKPGGKSSMTMAEEDRGAGPVSASAVATGVIPATAAAVGAISAAITTAGGG